MTDIQSNGSGEPQSISRSASELRFRASPSDLETYQSLNNPTRIRRRRGEYRRRPRGHDLASASRDKKGEDIIRWKTLFSKNLFRKDRVRRRRVSLMGFAATFLLCFVARVQSAIDGMRAG